ncbi:hypothetical protein KXD93_08920 [Mucilaginibacter sp. BJC16-A38]|uniref:hypothetical protein n=1 Tax=Mucilaginibacter phenanthrenivorans TaxID=1234842 RepID=UPI002158483D|nr:hypothetical protein [Mucilaginibacter phenanthrenivorans]MCR8557761.1 hypothetical protein [Mucilaginibacter phenanthrenivorans]
MKRILRYSELWQKKRRELPVKGNPDMDWLQMSSILDKQMPVPGIIKKPFRFKMPKWGLHVFVGVSSVAAVYVGSQLYYPKKHHDQLILHTRQMHQDSIVPAANDTSPAQDTVKPLIGISPVIHSADPSVMNQTKLNSDSTQKREEKIIDSIKAPAALNIPIRLDSSIVPMKATLQKAARDSTGAVSSDKKDIQKDTSKTDKKLLKKKKRSRFSVFF